jgi:hypothetical protein
MTLPMPPAAPVRSTRRDGCDAMAFCLLCKI